MRNISLAVAIGGILASAAASAANYDVFIGGASAQSAFFKADFSTSVCGAATNVMTFNIANTGGSGNPSNEAWRCTVAAGTGIAGLVAGVDVVTVHYNSELGSISGVSPLAYDTDSAAPRLFVNPGDAASGVASTTTNCPAGVLGGTVSCNVVGYDNHSESLPTPDATLQSRNAFLGLPAQTANFDQFEVGVTDLEIKHWGQTQNWTDATFNTAFNTIPSVAQLNTAATGDVTMNGQVFSVIVNPSSPVSVAGFNLSKQSLAAIFNGKYATWGSVPEVALNPASTAAQKAQAIKVCRREFGSGTQVAASVFFTGKECAFSSQSLASQTTPGALGANISEETSTGNVRTCVGTAGAAPGNAGAIGVASLSIPAGTATVQYNTLNIDGIQANAHNAAAGIYGFSMESHVYNKAVAAGASAPVQAIVSSMITNARRSDKLTSQVEAGSMGANGQWTATTRRSNYALPIAGLGNTAASTTKWGSVATTAVVALGTKNGNNCAINFNVNSL
jgi:hypothetical protein